MTIARHRSFGAGAPFKSTSGNKGKIVGVTRKPLLATIESQEAGPAFTLNEETIIGAGGRRDTKGTRPQRAGRQHQGGIHGEMIGHLGLFTLFYENGFKLAAHPFATRFIRQRRDLSHGGTSGQQHGPQPRPPHGRKYSFDAGQLPTESAPNRYSKRWHDQPSVLSDTSSSARICLVDNNGVRPLALGSPYPITGLPW